MHLKQLQKRSLTLRLLAFIATAQLRWLERGMRTTPSLKDKIKKETHHFTEVHNFLWDIWFLVQSVVSINYQSSEMAVLSCFAGYFHGFCGRVHRSSLSTIPEINLYVALCALFQHSLWGQVTHQLRCLRWLDWASWRKAHVGGTNPGGWDFSLIFQLWKNKG